MKTLIFAVAALLCCPREAFSWSAPGHQAIALAALAMLKGTPAEAKINAILGDESVTNASTWLDRVRENGPFAMQAEKDEATAFGHSFPQNAEWHFCNFSVGSTNYSFTTQFAATDDVVHGLGLAISVLEGTPSDMTKLQALRSVIHLVGDIHQPLHCITGFYDTNDMKIPVLLTNVLDPKEVAQDRGGNQLMYTNTENFHHFWDLVLPSAVARDVHVLAAKLTVASLASEPLTQGHFRDWPQVWAGDSMVQANAAYDQLKFHDSALVPDPRHHGKLMLQIKIDLPGGEHGYKTNQTQRAEQQLKEGAVHLAQLLSKIKFQ